MGFSTSILVYPRLSTSFTAAHRELHLSQNLRAEGIAILSRATPHEETHILRLLNWGVYHWSIRLQSHLPFWMEAGQIPNFSIAMSTYHRVIRSMWNDMNDDPHFPGTTKNTHGTRFIDSFLPLLRQQLEVVPKKSSFINILTWLWKPLKPWPIFLDDLPSKTNCFFPYV